jgi:hypothetical protein
MCREKMNRWENNVQGLESLGIRYQRPDIVVVCIWQISEWLAFLNKPGVTFAQNFACPILADLILSYLNFTILTYLFNTHRFFAGNM